MLLRMFGSKSEDLPSSDIQTAVSQPSFAVRWAVLLRIREVVGSELGLEIGYP
jgi:hypothetical protein